MGLGPLNAIYQARFNKYLENRGLADTSQQKVYAFLGDGETDEVDAVGALSLAAREELDNLVFVVNCNLQRLDGPVRGNGSAHGCCDLRRHTLLRAGAESTDDAAGDRWSGAGLRRPHTPAG